MWQPKSKFVFLIPFAQVVETPCGGIGLRTPYIPYPLIAGYRLSAHSIPLPLTFLLLLTVRNRSRITRKCVRSAAQVARPSFLLFCFLSELQIIARFASIYFTSALTLVCLSPHLHFGAPSTLPEDSSFWAISEASWQTTPRRFCVFIYYALTRAFDRRNGSSIPLNFPPCFPFLSS